MRRLDSNQKNNFQSLLFSLLLFFFIQLFDILKLEFISFIIKNLFLIIFLSYNVYSYRKYHPHHWLLNPAVLASLFTFILGYCLTNYVYFIPGSEDEKLMFRLLGSGNLFYFNKAIDAIIIAAFAMWIGYNSNLGIRLYKFILRFPISFRKYFRSSFIPNMRAIYILVTLSIVARLYAIELGIYGYAQSPDRLSASIGIALILASVGDLMTLCLLIVSFSYYSNTSNYKYKITFYLILIILVIFGILSGSKGAVVLPFVLAFITYYIVKNKINKSLILVSVIFIVIAYLIIEPFRNIRTRDTNFQSTTSNIASTMIDAYKLNQSQKVVLGLEDIFTRIISRNAYLLNASRSMQYSDVHGLGRLDPDFLEKIYTIPLQTFIPRIIWTDKPLEDFSRWFSVRVWGSTPTGSVAMTPIGFLYFAGGLAFIFIGFIIIGIFQKTLWQFYLAGGGQLLIFLSFLSTVVLIDSAYNGMVVYLLRYFPILIILQSFLIKKTNTDFE